MIRSGEPTGPTRWGDKDFVPQVYRVTQGLAAESYAVVSTYYRHCHKRSFSMQHEPYGVTHSQVSLTEVGRREGERERDRERDRERERQRERERVLPNHDFCRERRVEAESNLGTSVF